MSAWLDLPPLRSGLREGYADAMLNRLFVPGMAVGFPSVLIALVAAFVLYARYAGRVEPERRVHFLVYLFLILVVGGISGFAGTIEGVEIACPEAGNLCGLFGFFVTGPVAVALAIL